MPDGWPSSESLNQLFCTQVDRNDPGNSQCVDVSRAFASLAGGELTFAPRHSLVAGLTYFLPVPESIGEVSLGATYTYTDKQFTSAPEFMTAQGISGSPYAEVEAYELVNFNLNWNRIAGSNFDAALFVTNALDEEYVNYVTGAYHSLGIELRVPGQPRMWGARLRYTFGE